MEYRERWASRIVGLLLALGLRYVLLHVDDFERDTVPQTFESREITTEEIIALTERLLDHNSGNAVSEITFDDPGGR